MKGFKKLLLTSAILAASSSALAMQAMDDESMSATTGQDGLTVMINTSDIQDMDITWVDRDGFTGFADDGAVVINDLDVTINNLQIDIDAGSNVADGPQLNIGFATTDDIVVGLNSSTIEVATGGVGSAVSNNAAIIRFGAAASFTVTGGVSGSIKLGNRAAGEHFMSLDTDPLAPFDIVLTGGLTILDVDNTAAAGADVGIGIGRLAINDVVLSADIDVVDAGLQISTTGTSIGEVAMETVRLGNQTTAASIGDIYLNGLDVNSTITISGH